MPEIGPQEVSRDAVPAARAGSREKMFLNLINLYRLVGILWKRTQVGKAEPGVLRSCLHNLKRYVHCSVHCSTVYSSQGRKAT